MEEGRKEERNKRGNALNEYTGTQGKRCTSLHRREVNTV